MCVQWSDSCRCLSVLSINGALGPLVKSLLNASWPTPLKPFGVFAFADSFRSMRIGYCVCNDNDLPSRALTLGVIPVAIERPVRVLACGSHLRASKTRSTSSFSCRSEKTIVDSDAHTVVSSRSRTTTTMMVFEPGRFLLRSSRPRDV